MARNLTITLLLLLLVGVVSLLVYPYTKPYAFYSADKLYNLGQAAQEAGINYDVVTPRSLDSAIVYYELAITKGYRPKSIFKNLYICYIGNSLGYEAEPMLSKAVDLYPSDREFWYWRANSRLAQRKFKLAIEDYDQALLIKGNFEERAYAYYDRGAARYMLGHRAAAEQDQRVAQSLHKESFTRSYDEYCNQFR